ncbi:substrate-binding domain-containing protein [Dactylosporangium vinaceum]|uniref:Substrate-binding domain-containing protein n=1 Tax=Dactylosporangium vinaceum TaxID=53362 RepID=A0ABV5M5Z7_9ACTN|nr:substrate-binding domain-containing protein [Dactylosporangium vinaceum]UAC01217.1 substrate-binding domain-containing protein [Dactylosporangium vinaceum]
MQNPALLVEAAGQPSRRGGVVFVRCPHPLTGPYGIVVESIVDTLERHGRVVRFSAGARSAPPDVDGAILIGTTEMPRLYPFVLVDTHEPAAGVSAVWADRAAGVQSLVTHLRERGHRQVATIAATHDGGRAARCLLDRADPPTAIVCATAALGLDVLRAAPHLDVAVYDETGVGPLLHPGLTVARPPWAAMGRTAASALVALLEGAGEIFRERCLNEILTMVNAETVNMLTSADND